LHNDVSFFAIRNGFIALEVKLNADIRRHSQTVFFPPDDQSSLWRASPRQDCWEENLHALWANRFY
jgi:hypothetical protein